MAAIWSDALRRAADAFARRRRIADGEEGEGGFTLIELMVVLLIMGILMAIAIPTFLGVTNSANDRSTQSNLTNVLTSAKAIYAQKGGYPKTTLMKTDLTSDLPNFTYLTAAGSTKQGTIAIATAATTTGTVLIAAAFMTKTTVCWFVKDTAKSTVKYSDLQIAKATAATKCIPGATGLTWTTKWPTPPAGH